MLCSDIVAYALVRAVSPLMGIQKADMQRRNRPVLYRATLLFLTAPFLSAQTFTTVFSPNFSNGSNPSTPNGAALLQGPDGNFYGTTGGGGVNNGGCGTVYQLTPAGVATTLHSFNYSVDGCDPTSGLILGSDGFLYGTTHFTIFKISLSGTFTLLYTMSSGGPNLINALVQASDGNFYGTSSEGGTSQQGTVFRMTPSGALTVLLNFPNPQIGGAPKGPLIQASDGNLYGTTSTGGSASQGTVFKMTLGGTASVLYNFCATSKNGSCPDGAKPWNGVLQAKDGNLYGTTQTGGSGTESGQGTIFKLTLGGALTTLYSFCPTTACPDGNTPQGALIQGQDGNFYGVTSSDGMFNQAGTVFQLTPSGQLTTLHEFCSQTECADGSNPAGALLQASNGLLYGATGSDGPNSFGTVFSLGLPAALPSIAANGVENGASFQPGIVPGSWATIQGSSLSVQTDTWANFIVNGKLPTTVDGVSVSVGGNNAYVYYISPSQINFIVPSVGSGSQQVIVTNSVGASAAVTATVDTYGPAFFGWPNNQVVATRQDFTYAVQNGTFAGTTTTPAKPGDTIILWGTGFGPTMPAAPAGQVTPSDTTYNTSTLPTVTINNVSAIVYGAALAPGFAGLYQVAIQVPTTLGNGNWPVIATIGNVSSPTGVILTVQE